MGDRQEQLIETLARIDKQIADVDSHCSPDTLAKLRQIRRQVEGELVGSEMFSEGDRVRIKQRGLECEVGAVFDYGQSLGLKIEGLPGLMKVKASDVEPLSGKWKRS